jgi:hypothetical protein
VPPDLEVTRKSRGRRRSSAAEQWRRIVSGVDVVEHVQAAAARRAARRRERVPALAGRSAVRSAIGPERRAAEDEAPRRRSSGRASASEVGALREQRRGVGGRSKKPSSPRACFPVTAACAPRNRPALSAHSASVTTPGRNMFV